MGIYYNTSFSTLPYFYWDSQSEGNRSPANDPIDLITGKSATITNVSTSGSGSATTYTFSNGTNAFGSTSDIKFTPEASKYNDYFLQINGCAAFVAFKCTSHLSTDAPGYFRQTPFSMDTDSGLGAWNFEKFTTQTLWRLRVKFDQDGTYGFTRNIGNVDLNVPVQIGFQIRNSRLLSYVNGQVTDDFDISSKTLAAPRANRSLGIGASNGDIYGFIGDIYNAAWWNTSLSDDEVRIFYEHTAARYNF